jgi:flavin reductase (DIM6/NTAB) family NADH-FMN oxidoreductase RutF
MTASHNAPPQTLDRPLEVAPGDWETRQFYLLMTALVIPRPVGWISTVSAAGVRNLAPYSYFNLMGSDPFYVAFGSTGVKDTLTNVRETRQFVANIATMHLLEKMNFTSGDFPREEDEFGWAGLTPAPSAKVRPPRVAEGKAHLECELVQVVTDDRTNIVLGRIVHAHVDPSVWKDGRVDPRLLDPICRLSGSGYATLGELHSVPRPEWKNVQGTSGQEAMPRAARREAEPRASGLKARDKQPKELTGD